MNAPRFTLPRTATGAAPVSVALGAAMFATCFAGWLFKSHCLAGGWTGAEQYTTGCYSDVVPFWLGRGVAAGQVPYFQVPIEYPVLTGLQIGLEGLIARLIGGAHANDAYFLGVVAFVNAAIAWEMLWMFAMAGVDRRRLWAWAVAPPLILYLGHNWDMAAVGLAAAAMLRARRGHLAHAAALAGLGAAAKLFPALLLPVFGLAALVEPGQTLQRRIARAGAAAAAAIAAWGLVNLPVALLAFDNWSMFYRFSQSRPGTAASLWEIAAHYRGWFAAIDARNLAASIVFLGGALAILGIGGWRHRDRLWVLGTPLIAWFLLTNKVYSPQFDLWLYPLLLLTAPRLVPVALFALADLAAYFAEFWWFAGMEHASPAGSYDMIAVAAGLRALVLLWLIADALLRAPPEWVRRRGD